jgi:alkylation response protein AidB-like acyl-CoA dehydrogenase
MDFSFTPEEEAFRSRLRKWLEETSGELFGRSGEGMGASTASLLDVSDDAKWQGLREYHKRLYEAGYVALHWPKEWGGGGASLIEQAIYQDEVLRLGLPLYGANQLAIDRLGPTIILLGTEQQKERYLGKMLTGRAFRPAPCSRATPSWSTGRRSGRASRSARTCKCCWSAPTPPRPSTRASRTCWST